MLGRLKNFFTALQSKNDSVVGVDIGSAYVKAAQLRRKGGKAVLETYGSLALGPYAGVEIGRATHLPADKLAEALRDVLREAHVTSKKVAFAIPFSSSLVTSMDMRVLDMKQLPTMVSLEARKYIPVPISEVNLDWWIIPEETTVRENVGAPVSANSVTEAATDVGVAASGADAVENVKILIAAIHNEALNRYHDVVRESGLESRFFEIELFSTIRSLLPQDLEAHAVLDLGAGESKLYIIDRGLIRLSHIVSRGGQDITLSLSRALGISVEEAEKMKRRDGLQGEGHEENAPQTAVLNIIFSETSRTLLSFEHKFGRKVQNVLLSGGGANLAGITALAQRNFSIPVERADPFKQVEAPAFLEEVLKQVGPEFTVALGVAFRELQESG
jgi:type IV pilus assembly protein PilM